MRGRRRIVRPGALPVAELPSIARTFAQLPYGSVTQHSYHYHLKTYERWCRERQQKPWPPTLPRLLSYGAEAARCKGYHTVREHIRIVSNVGRTATGMDLYAHPTMQRFLQGVKRDRPPAPVRPLRPSQVDALLSYEPQTSSQRRARTICLLTYCAGLRMRDHVKLRCEMISIGERGAMISDLHENRPAIFIGRARNTDRCPVRALEGEIAGRASGPVFVGTRCRAHDHSLAWGGLGAELAAFGRAAGVSPLSFDRLRVAGLLEQVQHIDIVRLAHFHGYRNVDCLARVLGRYVPVPGYFRKRGRER